MLLIHLKKKKDNSMISLEMSLNAPAIHEMTSSSDGFFWQSVTVELWILSAIHCLQLFLYLRNTSGYRTEVNLCGIRAKLVFDMHLNFRSFFSEKKKKKVPYTRVNTAMMFHSF